MSLLPFDWAVLIWQLVPLAFTITTWVLGRRWLAHRHRYQPPRPICSAISIVKPIRGAAENTFANLAATFHTGYPGPLELVVAIETPDDPAAEVVRDLQLAYPTENIRLVVSYGQGSIFGKHANLIAGYNAAANDVVVFSDADVKIEPGLLQELVPPLMHPNVGGSTTGFYQDYAQDLPTNIMAMFVGAFAWVPNIALRQIGHLRWCVGGLMGFRKTVLERFGGLEAIIGDKISDDAALGKTLRDNGYSIYLCGTPYHVIRQEPSVGAVLANIHRWMLMFRTQGWLEYLQVLIVNPVVPLFVWGIGVAVGVGTLEPWLYWMVMTFVWEMLWGGIITDTLQPGRYLPWQRFLSRPIGQVLFMGTWLWGLLWPFTVWGGRMYRVFYEGGAELVGPVEPLEPLSGPQLKQRLARSRETSRRAVRLLRYRLTS